MVEVGCGPGHVTAYLADAGADASGLDLSPAMVAEARSRFPDGSYEVGDLRRLMRPTYGAGWSAVLAWYSLIHLAASELPEALAALTRPLLPGGWLVVALHAGSEIRHLDEWFDAPVDLDFVLHDPADVVAQVGAAGLVDVEWYHRGPITARGETTQRLYVVGRKPAVRREGPLLLHLRPRPCHPDAAARARRSGPRATTCCGPPPPRRPRW